MGSSHPVNDAVDRYCAATEANDIDAIMSTLSRDPELVSPISGRVVFRGREDLRILLGVVYGTITDLRWGKQVGDGEMQVAVGDCRIGPLQMTDAMVFDLDSQGRIRRIRPHLRPWLALTLFAALLGPKVARHPGVIRRALRSKASG
jgi:hypothetical protein